MEELLVYLTWIKKRSSKLLDPRVLAFPLLRGIIQMIVFWPDPMTAKFIN